MSESWRRHDLLRVDPRAWPEILEANTLRASLPYVRDWPAREWPLIVRRRTDQDEPALVPVALPLPPDGGKTRLALQVGSAAVRERVPALTLRRARTETPPHWDPMMTALLEVADRMGVEPTIFGSVLWQCLTGLPYLSATSDLDLLWPVRDLSSARKLVEELAAIEAAGPVQIDGEIHLPDGAGVQWRELLLEPAEVLVKMIDGVELRPLNALSPTSRFAAA
jgi:phosphoribosyl-dephospho-CoA transferase